MKSGGSFLLGLILAGGVLTAQATEAFEFKYIVSGGGVVITGYNGLPDSTLSIPTQISGTNVVGIGDCAFTNVAAISKVVIPSSVSSIGKRAFADCKLLKSVVYPTSYPGEFTDKDDGFLNGTVSIDEGAFSGCRALTTIELPQGLTEISDGMFENCSSLTKFDVMPYTVDTIGEGAFRGCKKLSEVLVTEHVENVEDYAFADCPKLKYVKYMGGCPSASTNIYDNSGSGNTVAEGRYVRSCYLSSMADSWAKAAESGHWPDSKHVVLMNAKNFGLSKYTVYYDSNKDGGSQTAATYFDGRVLGSQWSGALDEPEHGWWTARRGGRRVGAYRVIDTSALKSSGKLVYYAHWTVEQDEGGDTEEDDDDDDDDEKDDEDDDEDDEDDDEDEKKESEETVPDYRVPEGTFYRHEEDDDDFNFATCEYDGYLLSGEGEEAGLAGLLTLKVTQAKKGGSAKCTATFEFLGGKKLALTGDVKEGDEGAAVVELAKDGYVFSAELSLLLIKNASLTYEDESGEAESESYQVIGARNRFASGGNPARETVKRVQQAVSGSWNVILRSRPDEDGELSGGAMANGYNVLSVSINGTTGKAKVTGTMADGTKVSVSAVLIIGNGCCCLPVMVPLYTGKKGGFAFGLWFTWTEEMGMPTGDDEDVCHVFGLSKWDASMNKSAPFTASFDKKMVTSEEDGWALARPGDNDCSGTGAAIITEELPEIEGVEVWTDLLPSEACPVEVKITKKRWTFPENPSGFKATYTMKTGLFKGRFSVFGTVSETGRTKKYTATVNGALVCIASGDEESSQYYHVGLGTATIKKVGSVPVVITIDDNE